MMKLKETQEDAKKNIKKLLISDSCKYEDILQASLNLKKQYKYPDKIFSRLKLESLLRSALFPNKNLAKRRDILVNYGNCLVEHFGQVKVLDSKLDQYLKYKLMKLQTEHAFASDELISNLWSNFESGAVCQANAILNLSNETIERVVLNWMGDVGSQSMALISKVSAASPKLFQTITSVLFEALKRMKYHERVLEVINMFIHLVKRVCIREKKNFLKLYPKSCWQLVSLLMVSPKIHSEREKNIVSEVGSLLFEMFLLDRQKLFILLSHYSQWVSVLKAFIYENAPGLINSI